MLSKNFSLLKSKYKNGKYIKILNECYFLKAKLSNFWLPLKKKKVKYFFGYYLRVHNEYEKSTIQD